MIKGKEEGKSCVGSVLEGLGREEGKPWAVRDEQEVS